ncbi:MAG: adenylosuccinate synthase [Pseudomonadota bacterium]
MATCIVLGAQWGDEGKGKVVDRFAAGAQVVVRFGGGANAGHTIWHGDRKVVLHQLPSGVLTPGCVNLVGNGCVVDPVLLVEELEALRAVGVEIGPERLGISSLAHLVTPLHRWLDGLSGGQIGTTGRGIGPTYADKAERIGVRVGEIFGADLEGACGYLLFLHAEELGGGFTEFERSGWRVSFATACQRLAPYVRDVRPELHTALQRGQNVLYEGAQGALLDLDLGTYPFVTSSSTALGGALTGTGVYTPFDHRIAVVKAYTTRVGNGPFPTELQGALGEDLRVRGHEYGATTGRPRRCGWLDLPLLREAARASGYTGIALTKLDCLRGLPELRVAIDRDDRGEPVFATLPGWDEDILGAPSLEALPHAARVYIDFVCEGLGVPLALLSTGPERGQTLLLEAPW